MASQVSSPVRTPSGSPPSSTSVAVSQPRSQSAARFARSSTVICPNSSMAYSGVVAAVGVGAASGKTAGFCHYLGEMKDPETQAVRERYGKELFGQITVELRANRAADCERGCETATEVLLGGLPAVSYTHLDGGAKRRVRSDQRKTAGVTAFRFQYTARYGQRRSAAGGGKSEAVSRKGPRCV